MLILNFLRSHFKSKFWFVKTKLFKGKETQRILSVSNSQYFQGFFCSSGLVFVPLQFWFWYFKNIEVASEFTRAYPGPCGVREGGQTWAWLQQSSGTGTQPEAPEWTPTRSPTPFSKSSFFPTVCPRGGSCTPSAGLGNRPVAPAWAEHCPGSHCPAAPAQPLSKTRKKPPPEFEGNVFERHSFLNLWH